MAPTQGAKQSAEQDELLQQDEVLDMPGPSKLRYGRSCVLTAMLAVALSCGAVATVLLLRDDQPGSAEEAQLSIATPRDLIQCAGVGADCRTTMCCDNPEHTCFAKNDEWAACMPKCTPGVQSGEDGMPWSCSKLWNPALVKEVWAQAEAFAWAKVSQMDLEDKLSLIHGAGGGGGYAGYVNMQEAIPGSQALTMNDGPQGYNAYQPRLSGLSTQFPCLLALAATFDPAASERYANAVAEEFVSKGSNVMLGPDVEVMRAPLTGRSFETLSGEDPFLGATLVQPFVVAVQDHGVISVVKHWLDNNQEIYRQTMDVEVSDRTNQEIYMPVFKAAFDAGAAGVMCAYNKVYGKYACENDKLLKVLLRDYLGFRGFVVSDWGATHHGERSIHAGLDVEMPGGDHVIAAAKKLDTKKVEEMAVHVVAAMHYVGQFEGRFPVEGPLPKYGALEVDATNDWHREVALQTIVDSAVLLKNQDRTLPLQTAGKTIAMIGKYCSALKEPNYKQGSVWAGGGSGYVDTKHGISPLTGVMKAIGKDTIVTSSPDASAASGADVAVICVAAHSEEGWDRDNFTLPQVEELIRSVRLMNSMARVVVVAAVPGAVETEWVQYVDAALLLFMPGEQAGVAVAKLLTGEASPAGRLPISFPMKGEKRFTQQQYPGWCPGAKNGWCEDMVTHFMEDSLIGYRWNHANNIPSAYPFGFGLTYTEFSFDSFKAECSGGTVEVTFKVSNIGGRDGQAVPQVYVGFPSLLPVQRQLKGFKKVQVQAGQEAKVKIVLTEDAWSYFDEKAKTWFSAMGQGEIVSVEVAYSSAERVWQQDLQCQPSGRREWGCHRYSEGQTDDWCISAGIEQGYEMEFFGKDSPCDGCWCCKRKAQFAPQADVAVGMRLMAAIPSSS